MGPITQRQIIDLAMVTRHSKQTIKAVAEEAAEIGEDNKKDIRSILDLADMRNVPPLIVVRDKIRLAKYGPRGSEKP
ncbi:MAG: hypothetical protein KJ970_13255 [Candidatus Eisenbacteria bacterium]|uniref:Uncharacterized protein n=1 Tax=Eiseniibacteriota bacterium TaxID=2212470 RepID=A0A948W469_UNCEI|nr:hypothetical protein [Candidatus Eisenbacteria bacterium]MBU1948144.1 hypothetical protein [Candidatus Eisenbacteria bacterium]MBU2691882.1 hypothetical protein [Candidatus Eisenbacteria bacterium]